MRPQTAVLAVLISFLPAAAADSPEPLDIKKLLVALHNKFDGAKTYAFEGDLQVDAQRGEAPGRILAKAKVKLAVAPGGKSFLHVQPVDKDEYMVVSDGQKSWAYVPRLKQYTETDGGTVEIDAGSDEDDNAEVGGATEEKDVADTFSHLVIQALGDILKTARSAAPKPPAKVKFEGRSYTWPVIQVVSKESGNGQYVTEVTIDPETLNIGRLLWANISLHGSERSIVRMTLDFSALRVGEPQPDATFAFDPPKKAKLVDAVPIPGQTGSFLLNKPAPEFEAKTLDGDRVTLAGLRDHPVMLNFWASWCGPCRRELPYVVKLAEEMKGKGLIVLGVNDEDKGTAKNFANKAGISFPTLDDGGLKLHRAYRVSSIPSIFIIDPEGKVVRFLKGAHDEKELRAALKSVGL